MRPDILAFGVMLAMPSADLLAELDGGTHECFELAEAVELPQRLAKPKALLKVIDLVHQLR